MLLGLRAGKREVGRMGWWGEMVGNLAYRHSLQDWALLLPALHSFELQSQRQVLEC
jgi:hypothetical protein